MKTLPKETPLEDLRLQALVHYDEAAGAIGAYSSFVKDAILAYVPPHFRELANPNPPEQPSSPSLQSEPDPDKMFKEWIDGKESEPSKEIPAVNAFEYMDFLKNHYTTNEVTPALIIAKVVHDCAVDVRHDIGMLVVHWLEKEGYTILPKGELEQLRKEIDRLKGSVEMLDATVKNRDQHIFKRDARIKELEEALMTIRKAFDTTTRTSLLLERIDSIVDEALTPESTV